MKEVVKFVSDDGEMYDTMEEAVAADHRHNFEEFVEDAGNKVRHPHDLVHLVDFITNSSFDDDVLHVLLNNMQNR